jgi:uroporphyrinogen-III decarboxylase
MTPRERFLGTIRGQTVDRVPIILHGLGCQSHSDIAKMGNPFRQRLMERIIDETHFTAQVPSYINRMLVTPPQRIRTEDKALPDGNIQTLGIIDTPKGNLTFESIWDPRTQTSWMVKYPVESVDDIEKIASVPWELPVNLNPPNLNNLPEEFAERGIMATSLSSPFVCVSAMMDYEMFLEYCFIEYDLIKELTEICKDRILDCVRVLMSKPGIDYVWIGGSEWVTPPMAPPDIYNGLVQEQEREIIDYVHKNGNAVTHIHCHGRIRDALPKMIARGGDYTEPVEPPPDGDITMAEAKKVSAGRITLGGNIECRILCNENEDAVEKAVRNAFGGGKHRFILSQTADHSPIIEEHEYKNYMRMIEVWEEMSPI